MNPQTTEMVLRAGNPVPTLEDPPSGAIEADALFALLEKERWDMTTTKTRPSPPQSPRGGRRGMLLAAATFTVVIIVGISLAFAGLGPDDDENGPGGTVATTTQTPTSLEPETTAPIQDATTTTEPPPPDPSDVAIVDEALTSYSAGDVGGLMALIADSAELREGPETRPNDLLSRETFRIRADFAATIGERFELGGCRTLDNLISCEVEMSDDFTRGVGVESVSGSMAFQVVDGQVTFWRVDKSSAHDVASRVAIAGFERWHQEMYPDDPFLHVPSNVLYSWERLRAGVEVTPLRIAEYLETLS